MAKSNEQLEDILDDLSVIKNNNVATEQRLGNIENLLAKLATKEDVAPITPVASTSAASIPYDEIKSAVHEEMDSYFNAMSDSTELLSNKTLKRLGTIFMVKTEDIHPPKTGISVHFCVLSLMAMQK